MTWLHGKEYTFFHYAYSVQSTSKQTFFNKNSILGLLLNLKTFLVISTIQTRTNENQAEKDLDEIIEKAKKVKVNNEKLKDENKKLKVISITFLDFVFFSIFAISLKSYFIVKLKL